jgi:hypothetical protein
MQRERRKKPRRRIKRDVVIKQLVLVQMVNDDISIDSSPLFSHYSSRDQGLVAKEEKEGEAAGLDCTVAVFTPNLTE